MVLFRDLCTEEQTFFSATVLVLCILMLNAMGWFATLPMKWLFGELEISFFCLMLPVCSWRWSLSTEKGHLHCLKQRMETQTFRLRRQHCWLDLSCQNRRLCVLWFAVWLLRRLTSVFTGLGSTWTMDISRLAGNGGNQKGYRSTVLGQSLHLQRCHGEEYLRVERVSTWYFLLWVLSDAWSHIVSHGWEDALMGHLRRESMIQDELCGNQRTCILDLVLHSWVPLHPATHTGPVPICLLANLDV